MMICILGRQPAIALAELEAVYGAKAVRRVSESIAFVDANVDFARFGSLIKIAKLLTPLEGTNPQKGLDYCRRALPEHLGYLPEGKLKLGVSLYGLSMPLHKLNANVLSLKKVVKNAGRSVRVVPNTELALSSAQTMHNQLTSDLGMELVLVKDGDHMLLGQVTDVQDINDYGRRDRGRPKRDARVGMLPPKLAQVIINLAVSSNKPSKNFEILDPFCGTGVILQEALLMGYSAHGSDIDQRMVDYTSTNVMDWLPQAYPSIEGLRRGVSLGDATSMKWKSSKAVFDKSGDIIDTEWVPMTISAVACEGFLGTPFSAIPSPEKLRETIHDSNTIMKKFLKNIAGQLAPGTRLCIGAPAWFTNSGIHHLPVLDDLENLGYNRIDFEHARREDLIYHREDQIVGRELVVLVKE